MIDVYSNLTIYIQIHSWNNTFIPTSRAMSWGVEQGANQGAVLNRNYQ